MTGLANNRSNSLITKAGQTNKGGIMKPKVLASALALAAVFGFSAVSAQASGLVEYIILNQEIPEYLAGTNPGDAKRGKEIAVHRKMGNCLACHQMPIPEEQDHGLTGPTLSGVGSRMSEGELRIRLIDPKRINADTMMPAFYKVDGLHRVLKKFKGKPILQAQDIEDVVAYLKTLKD